MAFDDRTIDLVRNNNPSFTKLSFVKNSLDLQQLRQLRIATQNNDKITSLDLKYGHFDQESFLEISKIITNLKNLKIIDLSSNNIDFEVFNQIISSLLEKGGDFFKTLEKFDLSDNKIALKNEDFTKYQANIRDFFTKFSNLSYLSLNRTKISAEFLSTVFDGLKNNNNIEELFLGGNNLNINSMRVIDDFFTNNKAVCNSIKTLDLSNSSLMPNRDEEIAILLNIIQKSANLQKLILRYCSIDDAVFNAILSCLDKKPNFKEIDLLSNTISFFEGYKEFKNINLFKVNLAYNQIGSATTSDNYFIDFLQSNKNLQYLNLEFNDISFELSHKIFANFRQSNLQFLSLKGNKFSFLKEDYFIDMVGEFIAQDKLLITLDLFDVGFHKDHLQQMLNFVSKSSIKNLNISSYKNNIDEQSFSAVFSFLKDNHDILNFDFFDKGHIKTFGSKDSINNLAKIEELLAINNRLDEIGYNKANNQEFFVGLNNEQEDYILQKIKVSNLDIVKFSDVISTIKDNEELRKSFLNEEITINLLNRLEYKNYHLSHNGIFTVSKSSNQVENLGQNHNIAQIPNTFFSPYDTQELSNKKNSKICLIS